MQWTGCRTVARAVDVLRHEGAGSLWFRILGETVYRRVVLMERLLSEPIAELAAHLPVAIDLLKETEVDEYTSFRPEVDPFEIRRRLDAGHRAFVARHGGRIVHAGWAAAGGAWIRYLSCEITLAADEAYQYESFTTPGFRGFNIAPLRITEMMRYFRGAGFRRLIAVVVPENAPAFRPLEKSGYRPFGVMGYVKIGRWRWNFCRMSRNSVSPAEFIVRPALGRIGRTG